MRGIRRTRGIFNRIPGNLLEDPGECYYFNIPGNAQEDSGKSSRRFRGMIKKIPWNVRKDPGNVQQDSGECSKRFWGI